MSVEWDEHVYTVGMDDESFFGLSQLSSSGDVMLSLGLQFVKMVYFGSISRRATLGMSHTDGQVNPRKAHSWRKASGKVKHAFVAS